MCDVKYVFYLWAALGISFSCIPPARPGSESPEEGRSALPGILMSSGIVPGAEGTRGETMESLPSFETTGGCFCEHASVPMLSGEQVG